MKIKQMVSVLLILLLAASLFAGCSGSGGSGSPGPDGGTAAETPAADSGDNTPAASSDASLQIWVYGWEKASADEIKADTETYLAETGVSIEVVPVASDSYSTKIQATLAGGSNPDLAFVDAGVQSIQLASKGKLLELDDYGVGEYKDRFYDSVWDTMVYQGKVHGLRITANNLALYYNKDMFDEAGLSYPTVDWTWEDLRSAAATLTTDSVHGLDLPIYDKNGGYTWTWLPFLWQNGGQLLNEDRTEAIFNSAEAREALEFWKAMAMDDGSIPLQAAPTGVNRFTSRMTAMTIDGPWNLSTFISDPDFRDSFDVAPLPQRKARATVVGGEGVVIFSNTKFPQEAYDYLVRLTCSDFTQVFWENWITIPPQPEFADFYQDLPDYGPYIQVFSDQMSVSQTRQFTPSWPQVENALGLGLQDYMFGRTDDAQAALDATVADVNKILLEEQE